MESGLALAGLPGIAPVCLTFQETPSALECSGPHFSLRLHRHGVLEWGCGISTSLTSTEMNTDGPRLGAQVDNPLQLFADLFPAFEHVRQNRFADDVAQRGLCCPADGNMLIGHIECGLFRVDDFPHLRRQL